MDTIKINLSRSQGMGGAMTIALAPMSSITAQQWGQRMFDPRRFLRDNFQQAKTAAFRMAVSPDGRTVEYSFIVKNENDDRGGYVYATIAVDIRAKKLTGKEITASLRDVMDVYQRNVKQPTGLLNMGGAEITPDVRAHIQQEIDAILTRLNGAKAPQPATVPQLVVPKGQALMQQTTFWRPFNSLADVEEVFDFPAQNWFNDTASVYLIQRQEQPAPTPQPDQRHRMLGDALLRTYPVMFVNGASVSYGLFDPSKSPYVQLPGVGQNVSPKRINVQDELNNRTGVCTLDGGVVTVDESKIKFYYPVRISFTNSYNNQTLRGGQLKLNGQPVKEENGVYNISIPVGKETNTYALEFRHPDIVTYTGKLSQPEILRNQAQISAQPQEAGLNVDLELNTGESIHLQGSVPKGSNALVRLKNCEGVSAVGFNNLRISMKPKGGSMMMILGIAGGFCAILALWAIYALCYMSFSDNRAWPFSTKQVVTEEKVPVEQTDSTANETDPYLLESADMTYLDKNNVWIRDSIKSDKYRQMFEAIANGDAAILADLKTNGLQNRKWIEIANMMPSVKQSGLYTARDAAYIDGNKIDLNKFYETASRYRQAESAQTSAVDQPTNPQHSAGRDQIHNSRGAQPKQQTHADQGGNNRSTDKTVTQKNDSHTQKESKQTTKGKGRGGAEE